MRFFVVAVVLCCSFPSFAQAGKPVQIPEDTWQRLRFLEGSWEAATQGGTAGAKATGAYTFSPELNRHILARHTSEGKACSGPDDFNCDHHDLLYVYQESGAEPVKAIYFDSEGHVIHYLVTTPEANKAVFLSEATQAGPRFRLSYELKDSLMHGQFAIQMPGQAEWTTYLAWKGGRR